MITDQSLKSMLYEICALFVPYLVVQGIVLLL